MALPPLFAENKKNVNVIVETPRGSGNKFTYDAASGLFKLGKILPVGTFFPLHFGFLPHTIAEDGDPFDVMLLMDSPAFPGIYVESRIIGVMEAEQQGRNKKRIRNDRVLAIATLDRSLAGVHSLKEIPAQFLKEVISFLEYYNRVAGKKFKVVGIKGPEAAFKLIRQHMV